VGATLAAVVLPIANMAEEEGTSPTSRAACSGSCRRRRARIRAAELVGVSDLLAAVGGKGGHMLASDAFAALRRASEFAG
jgi:hypothetical protein